MAKHPRTRPGRALQTASEVQAQATAALDNGEMRLASRILAEALASEPRNPLLLTSLGNLHLKTGQYNHAESAFKAALTLDPEAVEASVGRVKVRMLTGRLDEAEALCRSDLVRFPDDLVLGQLLAQTLIDQKRIDEAIPALRDHLARHPGDLAGVNSLARRLSEVGQFDESREWFEKALSADSTNSFAYLGWVHAKTVISTDLDKVKAMEASLSARTLSERDRMQFLFALGKAYSDLKDYEQSMRFYREANIIRDLTSNKRQPFQKETSLSYLSLTREIFTKETIAARQTGYEATPTPIFICGMFRSGTTLAEQILASHSAVAAGGELPYWLDQSAGCFDLQRRRFDFERAVALRTPYQHQLRTISHNARFVTDKMPGNYRLLGLLRILYPQAKFIHCRRHPVDTCLSIYMTPFNSPPNYAGDPEKLAFTYELYRQTMDHWYSVLDPGDIHELRYESLIDDPLTTVRELLEFCGLEFETACAAPELSTEPIRTASGWQARQPIYRSSVEKWRRYEPWLGPFRKLIEMEA